MTDIAARHVPCDIGNECAYCHNESWPCDAELLRRERDAKSGVIDQLAHRLDEEITRADAAEADAKALAKTVVMLRSFLRSGEMLLDSDERDIAAVLAAHDARVSHDGSDSATDVER